LIAFSRPLSSSDIQDRLESLDLEQLPMLPEALLAELEERLLPCPSRLPAARALSFQQIRGIKGAPFEVAAMLPSAAPE